MKELVSHVAIAFKCTTSHVNLQQALHMCLSIPAPPRVVL